MRGAGLADMVCAIQKNRLHRASAEMAFHVADIIQAFDDSASSRQIVPLSTACSRPKGRWENRTIAPQSNRPSGLFFACLSNNR